MRMISDQSWFTTPALLVLHDRDLQAFGVDVGGDAAERAADVRPVRHAAPRSRPAAVVEDRHREGEVVEVAAGGVGVVGEQDVARLDAVGRRNARASALTAFGHAADEHRQPEPDRDRVAVGGEQADGEVERLVDDHVVGGAHEVGLHLLGHGDDAVAHDLGEDRVGVGCLALSSLALPTLDDEIAEAVDLQAVARQQHRGRGVLLDQRRAGDAVAGCELVARIRRRLRAACPAARIHGRVPRARGARRRPAARWRSVRAAASSSCR